MTDEEILAYYKIQCYKLEKENDELKAELKKVATKQRANTKTLKKLQNKMLEF